MSITLRKTNGDLFLDPETGRPEIVGGPTKVDQELADLYLTVFDEVRDWGSSLNLAQLGSSSSLEGARTVMFLRLQQANARMMTKQSNDKTLDSSEVITGFSMADVLIDYGNQAIVFYSAADVGNADTVTKIIGQDFKPTSLMHVLAPPANSI